MRSSFKVLHRSTFVIAKQRAQPAKQRQQQQQRQHQRKSPIRKKDVKHELVCWMAWAVACRIEKPVDRLAWFMPFYDEAKLFLVLWLILSTHAVRLLPFYIEVMS